MLLTRQMNWSTSFKSHMISIIFSFCDQDAKTWVSKSGLPRIHKRVRNHHKLWSLEKLVINCWQTIYSPCFSEIHRLVISNWGRVQAEVYDKSEKHPLIPPAAHGSRFVLWEVHPTSRCWIQILQQPFLQPHCFLLVMVERKPSFCYYKCIPGPQEEGESWGPVKQGEDWEQQEQPIDLSQGPESPVT